MAVSASLLTAGGGASASSFNTASVTPTADNLIAVGIVSNSALPNSVTGNGLTWSSAITFGPVGTAIFEAIYVATGSSPSAGAITIGFASSQTEVNWVVIDFGGADVSSGALAAIVQSAHNETVSSVLNLTVTLAAGITSGNAVAAWIGHGTNQAQTAGSGYTKLGENGQALDGDWAHEWRADGTTTPSMSWASSDAAWGLAVEIKAAGVAVGQQLGSMSTALHPGRGPSRVARFWQTPRSTEVVPGLSIGGSATPFHPGRGPSRLARFWQTPRSTSIPAGAAAATGAATGEQRSADVAGGVKGAAGAASSGTRTSGVSAGVKGAAGAPTGQQRTASVAAVRKQAVGVQVGEQRSGGIASGIHKAVGVAGGQQRTAGATVAFKQSTGAAGGQVHSSGVAVAASVAPVVPGHGAAIARATTGTAITAATGGTATAGTSGGTATAGATAGTVQTLDTQGEVTIG